MSPHLLAASDIEPKASEACTVSGFELIFEGQGGAAMLRAREGCVVHGVAHRLSEAVLPQLCAAEQYCEAVAAATTEELALRVVSQMGPPRAYCRIAAGLLRDWHVIGT